jgi:hypothetical protein
MAYVEYSRIVANCKVLIVNARVTNGHIVPCKLGHFCAQLQVLACKRGVFHIPGLFAKQAVKLKLEIQAANNKYGHRWVAIFVSLLHLTQTG